MAILLGETFHFQYLFIPYLGLPLVIFEEEKTRKKNIFALLGVLMFTYLRWHFYHFEPFITTTDELQGYSQIVVDFINLGVSLIILSIFLSENNKYINSIKDKQEQLERKNYELEHFTYICSHNLSEPLRTTSSFLKFIKKEAQGSNEKFDLYFDYIHDEMKIMDQMILSLLTFSKLSHEQEFKVTNLNGILAEIRNEKKDVISQKNVVFTYNVLPEIDAVPELIKLLFEHLITNAIKYQNESAIPEINITYKECSTYWQFCISDNGIGITDQNQDKIFDMFTRLHLKSEYEGIGVGLAFCKKIVEMHNGCIWFKPKQNEGSQFFFTIKKQDSVKI
ncbi:ATP-binding protein [Flammeovirga sp. OC4]|uniref:sensor histidine kinase n=1 Tax=Flammeovirga sp. OC4 TaxID=1382345 RepID=UPI00155D9B05|nr:ATP-binding protein [Flammeovirga sp. OC4]